MNGQAPPAKRSRRGPGRRGRRSIALLTAGVLALALAVTGCGGSGADSGAAARDQQPASEVPERPADADGPAESGADSKTDGSTAQDGSAREGSQEQDGSAERKQPKTEPDHVVRKARITVRVKDVPSALEDTRATVEAAGGYVGDETTDRDGRHERSHLVLRVPQEEYGDVLEELSGSGKLIERKVSADDVTDQVVDVKSRIASQKASVKRVRDLMDKATELSDIVSLESQLSTRQADLEALQARQASLEDRTAMATITLELSETEVKREKEKDDEPGFTDALGSGWDAFVTTLRWTAVVIGAVLPFLAALALLLVGWRLVRDRLPKRLRRAPRAAVLPTGAGGAAGTPGAGGTASTTGTADGRPQNPAEPTDD